MEDYVDELRLKGRRLQLNQIVDDEVLFLVVQHGGSPLVNRSPGSGERSSMG